MHDSLPAMFVPTIWKNGGQKSIGLLNVYNSVVPNTLYKTKMYKKKKLVLLQGSLDIAELRLSFFSFSHNS